MISNATMQYDGTVYGVGDVVFIDGRWFIVKECISNKAGLGMLVQCMQMAKMGSQSCVCKMEDKLVTIRMACVREIRQTHC